MVDENTNADCSKSGILSNNDRYSLFQIGDLCIKFKTSPYLKRYTEILKWNDGYIECMAEYTTMSEPVEEYIDLRFVAERLRLPEDIFENIREVRVA